MNTNQKPTDTASALEFFDSLPAVALDTMIGTWRGASRPTGSPLDGLLERYGWYGKRFDDAESVHPLLFHHGRGLVAINPALVPLPALTRFAGLVRTPIAARAFGIVRGALATGKPRARLRMTEHRGVVTATMCSTRCPYMTCFAWWTGTRSSG